MTWGADAWRNAPVEDDGADDEFVRCTRCRRDIDYDADERTDWTLDYQAAERHDGATYWLGVCPGCHTAEEAA